MDIKKDSKLEWKFSLDEKRKADSLLTIQYEVHKKRIRRHPSFAENVWNQLRFQSWKHWVMLGGVLLAAFLMVFVFGRNGVHGVDSIAACSVFVVFAGNIGLSSVARLFSRHMAELEKTLYLDLKQMVCIQMMEAGIVDMLVLGFLTGCIGREHEAGIFACLLYMLVPFLWSDVLYLHMLTWFRSIFSGFWQLSAGVLCAGLALFPAFFADAYEPEYVPVWGLCAVAGVLLLFGEICRILGKIEGGESLCLN